MNERSRYNMHAQHLKDLMAGAEGTLSYGSKDDVLWLTDALRDTAAKAHEAAKSLKDD